MCHKFFIEMNRNRRNNSNCSCWNRSNSLPVAIWSEIVCINKALAFFLLSFFLLSNASRSMSHICVWNSGQWSWQNVIYLHWNVPDPWLTFPAFQICTSHSGTSFQESEPANAWSGLGSRQGRGRKVWENKVLLPKGRGTARHFKYPSSPELRMSLLYQQPSDNKNQTERGDKNTLTSSSLGGRKRMSSESFNWCIDLKELNRLHRELQCSAHFIMAMENFWNGKKKTWVNCPLTHVHQKARVWGKLFRTQKTVCSLKLLHEIDVQGYLSWHYYNARKFGGK